MILTLLMGALVLRSDTVQSVVSIAPIGPRGLVSVKFIDADGVESEFTYDGKRQSLVIGATFATV